MKQKSYNIITFIRDIFCYIPLQATAVMIYTTFFALLPAFQTLAMADFIDTATLIFDEKKEMGAILRPLLCIGISMIYQNIMPVINSLVSLSGKNKLRLVIKPMIIWKQSCLAYHYLESKDSCDLIERVCDNIDEIFWNEYENLLNGIRLVINILSLIMIVFRYTLWGGIIIIIASIPLFWVASRMGGENYKMEKTSEELKRKYDYLGEVLIDRNYAQERHLFSYSSFITDKYKKTFNESYKLEKKILCKRYINMKSGSIITIFIGVIIMAILLPILKTGKMSSGVYIALVSSVFGLVQAMSWQMSDSVLALARLREYLKEYETFLNMEEVDEAGQDPIYNKEFVFQSLEFCNVSFSYPGTNNFILKNCSFKLTSEKTYAFVGNNGAGKTTITKLILGLYSDYEGKILLNGRDIKSYSYAERKGIIGVAFQDFAKYQLTIDKNVQLGRLYDYNEKKIREVLDEVGLSEMISNINDGIYAELGKLNEQSIDLSEGQWQRLEIARLLYSNRAINILDEPTAALDPMAETKIYELFQKIKREHFVIYITHRLGAARIADEILVLKDGHIVEKGNHKELVARKNGIYCKMYESQRRWYE